MLILHGIATTSTTFAAGRVGAAVIVLAISQAMVVRVLDERVDRLETALRARTEEQEEQGRKSKDAHDS
jgi:hypothetical protein